MLVLFIKTNYFYKQYRLFLQKI